MHGGIDTMRWYETDTLLIMFDHVVYIENIFNDTDEIDISFVHMIDGSIVELYHKDATEFVEQFKQWFG